jgi:hypothetical protein
MGESPVIQLVEIRVRRSELGCGKEAQLSLAQGGSTCVSG